MERICTKCKKEKPDFLFVKRTLKQKNGKGICLECKSKMDKDYRQKNKEKLSKYFSDKWKNDKNRREQNLIVKELKRTGLNATKYVSNKFCIECGLSNDEHKIKYKERLHIHHKKNTGRKNIRLGINPNHDELEILCRSCHVTKDNLMRSKRERN